MSKNKAQRPTWAEINLDNLAYNFHSLKSFIGKNIEYMAVVKADAYGHSAIKCAKRLENEGVDWFGVALPEEGFELRNNGITKPILCLGGFWSGQENFLLENRLTPVIYQLGLAKQFNKACNKKDLIGNVHIKIDTGMGRIGVRFDQIDEFIKGFKRFENLNIEGIMTHFAAADNLRENDFTNLQIKRFEDACKTFEKNGFYPKYKDLANSPGAVAHKNSRSNLVRLGGVLYGLGGDVLPQEIEKPVLKPVMSLYSTIALIKEIYKGETLGYGRTFTANRNSLIATIPIGYQDGLTRALSNRGNVIINGVYAPIIGRISMDWTIIDVTDVPHVKVNDEVIIIGNQNDLSILAEDIAKQLETISYEITCGINRRVVRNYVGSQ